MTPDLKPIEGGKDLKLPEHRSSVPSTELVRIALSTLALKNCELLSYGRYLANRPDPIWFQRKLNELGFRISLIRIRYNLRLLCKTGIMEERKQPFHLIPYAEKAQLKKTQVPEYYLTPTIRKRLLSIIRTEPAMKNNHNDSTSIKKMIKRFRSKFREVIK